MLDTQGYAVVEGVMDTALCARVRTAMYEVQAKISADIGADRLQRAGEVGVLRLMARFDSVFFQLLVLPEVLAIVDATVSPTAILHLQNGFILPPSRGEPEDVFQRRFHQDFPRDLSGYRASVNVLLAIDEFRADNGATLVVPGSQLRGTGPLPEVAKMTAHPATCPAGSMVIFDSTLWHAAGPNVSDADRLAVNHQFTRSWIKPQIDYVRALGDQIVRMQPPRTQQLLGWYTRVVTSLDDYYQPVDQRLYRAGQG